MNNYRSQRWSKKAKQNKTRKKNSKKCWIRRVLQNSVAPVYPVGFRSRGALDRARGGQVNKSQLHRIHRWCLIEAPVQAPCYWPENMLSSGEEVSSAPDEPVVNQLLMSLMLNLNRYSASAQNSPVWHFTLEYFRVSWNLQGSTMVKCIVNCSEPLLELSTDQFSRGKPDNWLGKWPSYDRVTHRRLYTLER